MKSTQARLSERGNAAAQAGAIFMAVMLMFATQTFAQPISRSTGFDKRDYYDVQVEAVINGYTLRLENNEILCLIGIDTPDAEISKKLQMDARLKKIPAEVLEVMGKEAAAFLKELVEGKLINVEFDAAPRDMYGALIGYVFADQGKIFVNAEIIKRGYTPLVNTGANKRYADLFEKLFQKTNAQSQGIWRQWQQ